MARKNNVFKVKDTSKLDEYIVRLRAAHKRNEGAFSNDMIDIMQEMRELFITWEQPTIVKSIRLAYEHIQKYGDFVVYHWIEEDEDDEMEAPEEIYTYDYYLGLISNPGNKYNREEIKGLNVVLKQSLIEDPYEYEDEEEYEDDDYDENDENNEVVNEEEQQD